VLYPGVARASLRASHHSHWQGISLVAFIGLACGLLLFAGCGSSPSTNATAVLPPTPTPAVIERPPAPRLIAPPDGTPRTPLNGDHSVTFEWEAVAVF
jgi:hypothetical protein